MAALLDVEQPLPPTSSGIINFEELFNMELFGPSATSVAAGQVPQSQGDVTSRGPSKSPGSSFLSLPDTTDATLDPAFFNFDLPNTFVKPIDLSASPSDGSPSSLPFNFFSSFSGSGSGSSPDTASSSATFSPKSILAIDPSLMGFPSPVIPPPPALQQHRSDPDENSEDEDDEDDEPLVQPVKVGGRGKTARKGTVMGGGVAKRTPAAVKDKSPNDDDWRPSPEEYKKMSSKEKRQLRNKISARNFRVRRKEYISTLEGDIAERDRLIDAIREELGSTKLENVALRQEVDALKRAMLEGRASPALPPPAPLTVTANSVNTTAMKRNIARTSLAKPNTQKDLPSSSPRVSSARAFWGGSLGGGGVTPVHATLIPDFPPSPQQENINPALNLPCFGGIGTTTPNPKFPLSPFQQPNLGANFDAFADLNPFTLKTLDAYRMQLWGRMAREAGAAQRSTHAQSQPSSLATALKPAFFSSPLKERDANKQASSTLSALLSGKAAAASYPTPPSSPPTRPEIIQPQHAMLAGLASQTLLSKMGSAFWDAFAGRNTGTSCKPELDHDKVRRVLEGKAVVRVVDVDASTDSLEQSMRGLSIGSDTSSSGPQESSNTVGARGTLFSRTRAAVVGKK